MNLKKLFVLMAVGIFVNLNFYAQEENIDFKNICEGLAKNKLIRGDFELSQYISKTGKELKSSGVFVLSADDGIIWFTEKPVKTVMAVTKNYMIQEINGKKRKIDGSKNPTFLETANVISAMFTGDYDKIMASFNVHYKIEKQGSVFLWKAVMTPKDETLASYFKAVEISGTKTQSDTFLERFSDIQFNDDVTTYRLKNQAVIDNLTDNEKQYF
ncbi:MAG: outer membrane lipoprotein carrier protein LolA [Treponema sp.]